MMETQLILFIVINTVLDEVIALVLACLMSLLEGLIGQRPIP